MYNGALYLFVTRRYIFSQNNNTNRSFFFRFSHFVRTRRHRQSVRVRIEISKKKKTLFNNNAFTCIRANAYITRFPITRTRAHCIPTFRIAQSSVVHTILDADARTCVRWVIGWRRRRSKGCDVFGCVGIAAATFCSLDRLWRSCVTSGAPDRLAFSSNRRFLPLQTTTSVRRRL